MIPAFFSSAWMILLECRESPAVLSGIIWYYTTQSAKIPIIQTHTDGARVQKSPRTLRVGSGPVPRSEGRREVVLFLSSFVPTDACEVGYGGRRRIDSHGLHYCKRRGGGDQGELAVSYR